ncbi:unnamed protein product [Cyclocybe aegerita]|uniref:Uncharacterized protein n=1 Tax=Cyclocybe aegerita TaxID=1973307 RepID=A0A8S0WFA7_CYCAE|nr:unnamed protein product [Cyclocybe aegerita]
MPAPASPTWHTNPAQSNHSTIPHALPPTPAPNLPQFQNTPAIPHAPPPIAAAGGSTHSNGTQPSTGDGVDIEVGPLLWGRDITGQARALINHLPNAPQVTFNIHARHGRTNFIIVHFPDFKTADSFVKTWHYATPPQYSRLYVSLMGN